MRELSYVEMLGAREFLIAQSEAEPTNSLLGRANTSTAVLKDDVLRLLSRASVMKGWDFVLSMDLKKVNKILMSQYKTAAENIPSEVVQTVTIEAEDQDTGDLVQIKFEGNLYVGPAKVLFTPENDRVKLEFEVYEVDPKGSGNKSQYVRTVEGGPSKTFDVQPNSTFTTIVPIEVVSRKANRLDVVLNLKAAIASSYTTIRPNGSTSTNEQLAKAVSLMFREKGYEYLFVHINQAANNLIPELVPTHLRFSMYQAHSRPVLNTFIVTTSRPVPQKPDFGITFPLPDALDIDCCMFISNRIAFRQIFYNGFNNSKDWQVDVKPALSENDFDSLSVSAQVFLEVPFPKVMNLSVPNDTIDVPMGDYGTADRPGLHIGAKFGQFDLVGDYKSTFNRQYLCKKKNEWEGATTVKFDNAQFLIDVKATSSTDLTLKYELQTTNMTIESQIEAAENVCDVESIKHANKQLSDNLKKVFTESMSKAVEGVPLQYLSNTLLYTLQFPGNYIQLNAANNPGDIVLWGTLEDK